MRKKAVNQTFTTEDEEDIVFLSTQEVERLSKDLRQASKIMSHDEARYLVSAYYSTQDLRKRFANQERAMEKLGAPHDMVSYMARQTHRMEKQIQISLDVYTYNDPVGQWLRANRGIGPVLAAGLLAHIDIHKAPTVGHIWRYAGLDPTMKWYGKGIADIIRAARQAEDSDWGALLWLSRAINMRPTTILINSGLLEAEAEPTPEFAKAFVYNFLGHKVELMAQFHADNALREGIPQERLPEAYAQLYKGLKIRWDDITKTLAKRPWNAELKTLLWKCGESFKKVSGGPTPSPYGLLYRKRKEREVERNRAGEFAETAAAVMKAKKLSKTTDAYYWYTGEWVNNPKLNPELEAAVKLLQEVDGLSADAALKRAVQEGNRELRPMLPPAHIDARASRYAVKMFLSHLHEIMYKRILKKNPPLPYPQAHLGHVHYIAPFLRDEDIVDDVAGVAAE